MRFSNFTITEIFNDLKKITGVDGVAIIEVQLIDGYEVLNVVKKNKKISKPDIYDIYGTPKGLCKDILMRNRSRYKCTKHVCRKMTGYHIFPNKLKIGDNIYPFSINTVNYAFMVNLPGTNKYIIISSKNYYYILCMTIENMVKKITRYDSIEDYHYLK